MWALIRGLQEIRIRNSRCNNCYCLERMFMSSTADEFECCQETFNFQNLIGHIKVISNALQNFYPASRIFDQKFGLIAENPAFTGYLVLAGDTNVGYLAVLA